MSLSYPESEPLTRAIIGAGIEVHSVLGPGLLESTYEECLYWELMDCGLVVDRQKPLPIIYKSRVIPDSYRCDFVVNNCVVVEAKAVEKVLAVHKAQVRTYLKLTRLHVGLLMNFNVDRLVNGISRISL